MGRLQPESEFVREGVASLESSPPGTGVRRLLILVGSLALLAGGAYVLLNAQHSKSAASIQAVKGDQFQDLNVQLLSQQLDEIYLLLNSNSPEDEPLSSEKSILLRSWLQYDERFVEHNKKNESLRYERVVAHLRLAHGLLILKQPESSVPHFQSAITLLESLIAENPKIVSYRLDLADSHLGLQNSLNSLGRVADAKQELDAAYNILQDPELPPNSGQKERLMYLYQIQSQNRTSSGEMQ